jgi:hypothetical protein
LVFYGLAIKVGGFCKSLGLYKDSVVEQFANKDFEKFADISAPYIKSSLVNDDLAKIVEMSKCCVDYTDQRIAHWDKKNRKKYHYSRISICVLIYWMSYM